MKKCILFFLVLIKDIKSVTILQDNGGKWSKIIEDKNNRRLKNKRRLKNNRRLFMIIL